MIEGEIALDRSHWRAVRATLFPRSIRGAIGLMKAGLWCPGAGKAADGDQSELGGEALQIVRIPLREVVPNLGLLRGKVRGKTSPDRLDF